MVAEQQYNETSVMNRHTASQPEPAIMSVGYDATAIISSRSTSEQGSPRRKRARMENGSTAPSSLVRDIDDATPMPFSSHALELAAANQQKEHAAAIAQTASNQVQAAEVDRRRAITLLEIARRDQEKALKEATSAAVSWRRLFAAGPGASIAQRCYRDALHCIFAFLSLKQILPAAHSCRTWYAAVVSEKGRKLTFQPRSSLHMEQLYASPLRKHVSMLNHLQFAPNNPTLRQLQQSMPHLHSLQIILRDDVLRPHVKTYVSRLRFVRETFPSGLRSLRMYMPSSAITCQLMLDALLAAPSLTELDLTLSIKWSRRLDFVPLIQLPALTKMALSAPFFTKEQLTVIANITTLITLNLNRGQWRKVNELAWLCRPPQQHLHQLQKFDLSTTDVDAAILTELAHLPSFCILEPLRLLPSAYPLLPRLSQLHTLGVRLIDTVGAYRTDAERIAVSTALSACPRLTNIVIEACKNADLLHTFLPLLVNSVRQQLRCLRLVSVSIRSLSFLTPALHLEELHVRDCCPLLAGTELLALRQYAPRLQVLDVMRAASVTREQSEQLRPPSSLLPSLRSYRIVL